MSDKELTPEEQLDANMQQLRDFIDNFRIVGQGVTGSFAKGYDISPPDAEVVSDEGQTGTPP